MPETAEREPSESFIALLLAAVWSREVERACRHGLPAFRRDQTNRGLFVRGRLDVRETVRLRAHGSAHVASVIRQRDLTNDVSRTLVVAERALHQLIGNRHWHTQRVKDMLPQLIAAVGARPRLPTERALERIRYTPITLSFKEVARLSWHIARREGLGAQTEAEDADGILLDVAELWELFLLNCVRLAAPGSSVEHGTTAINSTFLLSREEDDSFGMGKLKPDIVIRDGGKLLAVIDAKYKRLRDLRPERPFGVERSDLYQLASYLSRLDPGGEAAGMLLYPLDSDQERESTAESGQWWRMEAGSWVRFRRIPVSADEAVNKLRELLSEAQWRKAGAIAVGAAVAGD